ncbi:MAG: hypothetical protein LAP21_13300 [Acidobacteriia bacterium]|nr:hypothetical protein [Terriglobia bacterium]
MSVRRRQILKMIAFSPLVSLKSLAMRPFDQVGHFPPSGPAVNILLHGFFFMEFQEQDKLLIVASPKYDNHHFLFRNHGDDKLQALPQRFIDFRKQLAPGNASDFPNEILHFSRSQSPPSPAGNIIHFEPTDSYGFHMKLPCPTRIVPIRPGGQIKDFNIGGVHGNKIAYRSGPDLSLITCLQYDTNPSTPADLRTRNYYAEHCGIPDADEIKNMLNAASDAFRVKLDIVFSRIPTVPSCGPSLPNDDEKALREMPPGTPGNPCSKTKDCPAEQSRIIHTANCPQFGITS